jgi:light-regulated signal transduction histidine kinase (bacteriophytochrome)
MFETLFSNDFMPHGMCYMWRPGLLWLHVLSDGFIFIAYMCIPATLIYILRIRKDLVFSKVMALFGAFVLLCGITHLIAIWNVWNGTYWFSGWIKAVTALVSVATAFMLWRLIPTLRGIPTVAQLEKEIEKRKAVEAELQIKTERLVIESKRLSASNDELQAYAYASSHDLKSPLRGIKQLASWIEEEFEDAGIELPGDSKEHFLLLKSRISRMENLLCDLLEYSKVGHISGELTDINVKTMCQGLFDMLSTNSSVTLHVDDIPNFKTLEAPLNLVLRNLLDNAIKHNRSDKGNIWITVKDKDNYLEFTVKDDGPGVDPANFARMTKIFTTLQSRDEIEGSGIGLAIIQKIISKFEGHLTFESKVGEGLAVTFDWPKERRLKMILEPVQ